MSSESFCMPSQEQILQRIRRVNPNRRNQRQLWKRFSHFQIFVSDSFHSAFESLVNAIYDVNITDCCYLMYASPVIQVSEWLSSHLEVLLEVAEDPMPIIDTILGESPKDAISHLMLDRFGSHVVEKMITVIPASHYLDFYSKFFRKRMAEFAMMPLASWTVQQLIANAKDEPQVNMFFDELQPELAKLVENRQAGIVLKLIEASTKWGVKHKEMCRVSHLLSNLTRGSSTDLPKERNLCKNNFGIQFGLIRTKPDTRTTSLLWEERF